MGLIIALSRTPRDGGGAVLMFPTISVDSTDGDMGGAGSLHLYLESFSEESSLAATVTKIMWITSLPT